MCVAGSRLFIQKTKYEEILEGILKKATSLKLGSGFDPETEMGPLISENHRVYVDNLVRASISEGAEVICGGEKVSGMGFFYEPTIMAKIKNDMTVYRNEVFGPVLTVMPFEDEDEAVELANDTHFGLAGSIWTSDIARAHRMASSIRAGLIWINSHGIPDLSVPFGGYKQSGWGREMDRHCQRIMDGVIIPAFKSGNFSAGIVQGFDSLEDMVRNGIGKGGSRSPKYKKEKDYISNFNFRLNHTKIFTNLNSTHRANK